MSKFSMKIIANFTDLARSYEQKEQFNEAVNMWRAAINHCQHINQTLPLVSMTDCLLKIGKLDEAVISSVELVSLLESTADQIQPIIEECDLGICKLVEKFLEFKEYNVIFQLLQCRFKLLQRHYQGEVMFVRVVDIGLLMKNVAKVVENPDEIELFTKQYEFLDDMLLFIQNSPATNITHEVKCEQVASFSHYYGFCCNEVNDYVKAAMLYNQAIASWKLAFGDESNDYKMFASSYNNLGFALEKSNHLLEAKTAYQTSIKIKMQARDYENEEERNKSISKTQSILQRVENKLKNI